MGQGEVARPVSTACGSQRPTRLAARRPRQLGDPAPPPLVGGLIAAEQEHNKDGLTINSAEISSVTSEDRQFAECHADANPSGPLQWPRLSAGNRDY